jgi:hypothetical protein
VTGLPCHEKNAQSIRDYLAIRDIMRLNTIGAKKMLAALNSLRPKKVILVTSILFVLAATIAASCDWHSDLCFHKDCILCQLAQLVLVEPNAGLGLLTPPALLGWKISFTRVHQGHSPPTNSTFNRGPPA